MIYFGDRIHMSRGNRIFTTSEVISEIEKRVMMLLPRENSALIFATEVD